MAKLRDIAERAGTSIGTASLVLNDRAETARISERTQQAVLDAAHALGYSPNLSARRLSSGQVGRRVIVLAVAHPIDARLSLVARIISGMQRHLEQRHAELDGLAFDVQLTLETFKPGELRRLRGLDAPLWYNGLMLTNTQPEDEAFLEDEPVGVPVVLFQRSSARNSAVDIDQSGAAGQVAGHLAALGHRRLAIVTPGTATRLQARRHEGFLAGARAAGLPQPEHLAAPGNNWTETAHRAVLELLGRPRATRPTGLFASNDLLALGAVRAARDRGLSVPDDLAVVGFDDAEFAAFTSPALTTVHSPQEEMAGEAVSILLDLIQRKITAPVHRQMSARLVVRESCGAKQEEEE